MSQRLNFISRLDDFTQSWIYQDHSDNHTPVQLYTTCFGNINSTGEIGNYEGEALSPWHPQFGASLEPGVRDLVFTCVQIMNWITYTSCEGHSYENAGVYPVERYVGILPRDDAEHTVILTLLKKISQKFNRWHLLSPVRIDVEQCLLQSEICSARVIDLFLRKKRQATWKAYFHLLSQYSAWLVWQLREASRSSEFQRKL
jgi:hypothetical protein